MTNSRCLVHWLCDGRADAGAATVPWGVGDRPTCRDYKSAGHSYAGTDPYNEPQLYGAQIPPDQTPSIQQGTSPILYEGQILEALLI